MLPTVPRPCSPVPGALVAFGPCCPGPMLPAPGSHAPCPPGPMLPGPCPPVPGLTLSPRWAASPPGDRGTRPTESVSSHPHPARSAPSVWPPSGRPGSRRWPPGGTCRSWRRPRPRARQPGSLWGRLHGGLWRFLPGIWGSLSPAAVRPERLESAAGDRGGLEGLVARRRKRGVLVVSEGRGHYNYNHASLNKRGIALLK